MQEVLLWNCELRLGGRGGGRSGGGRPDGLAAGGEGGEEAVEEAAAGGGWDGQRGGDDGERGGEPGEAQQRLEGGPVPLLHGRQTRVRSLCWYAAICAAGGVGH